MGKVYVQKFPEVFAYSSGSVGAACALTGSFLCSGYSQIVGYVTSSGSLDAASGLRIQQSIDKGGNWDIISASQVSATSFTTSCMVDIIGNAVRVTFDNGATTAASLRAGFYLKPVAGTAKMPDVDIDVVTSIAEITAGSVDIAGALPTGTNSIGDIGTVGTVSSITAGSVDIAGALPAGTNLIGEVQPFAPMAEIGLTELVGTDEEINTGDFTGTVQKDLGGTYSGELKSFSFYTTDETSASEGAPQDSAGELLIFDASPTIGSGAVDMAACAWQAVVGKVVVAASDWITDASSGTAFIFDQPVPFHAVSSLYFSWNHTDGTDLNDNALDEEVLEFNAWYKRES